MLPLGVKAAVLKSAWASSHSTRSFFPVSRQSPRHGADRADGERVVAAQQDRQAPGRELVVDGGVDLPVPGDDFRQVTVAVARGKNGIDRPVQVAAVADVGHKAAQRLADAGDAQRLGTHVRAAHAGPDVGRGADDADVALLHGAELTAAWTTCVSTELRTAGPC